jgi:P4 family phage/plasmid primase-like protien
MNEKENIKDIDNSNDTSKDINLAINNISKEYDKRSKYNTTKLLELYKGYEDTLYDIIKNRDYQYPIIPYNHIIDTYDIAESLKNSDSDLRDAMIATCYYQIHSWIAGEENSTQFIDEPDDDSKSKPKLNLNKIAKYLIDKYCIISYNGFPYLYIGNQYYLDENKRRLKKDISKILTDIKWSDYIKTGEIKKDIIENIIDKNQKLNTYPFNSLSNELIPAENGVVIRKTGVLLPHSPAFRMLYRLNAEYHPGLNPKPVNEYLNGLVDVPEDADLLLQIPAQALLQNPQYQLAYALTGDGSNGKSLYIAFMQQFIGKRNFTSISLHTLTENRFAVASLEGKLMNLYPDLEKSAVKYLGIFKALTGGDIVQCERKYGTPFNLENKAVFCFSANELPDVSSDNTYAFWRRWCVIPFPHKFEADPKFSEKLTTKENMSIFLNLVIDKMNRIDEQGLSVSKRVDEARNLWKSRSSSAYAFVSDCISKDIYGKVPKIDIENLYHAYCEERDITIQDIKNVTNELIKMGILVTRIRDGSHFIYVYRGCKYHKPMEKEKDDIQEELLED